MGFVVHAALARLSPPLDVDCGEVVSRSAGEELAQMEVRRWNRNCQEVGDKRSSEGLSLIKRKDFKGPRFALGS